jgi:uncharacterized protein YkwD
MTVLLAVLLATAALDPADPTGLAGLEDAVVRAVNDVRQTHGLAPLAVRPELAAIARAHSRDMARRGYFDHRDPRGASAADRARQAGVRYRKLGENIAETDAPDLVATIVPGWLGSPGHRASILDPEFRQTGVGVWREGGVSYVTQVLVTPAR